MDGLRFPDLAMVVKTVLGVLVVTHVWLRVNTNGTMLVGIGEFTTHFRTDFSG